MYLDSGRIDSTFFTFGGLSAAPGRMASTRTLSKVQEVECLNCWISGGNGSEEVLPHSVPEHPDGAAVVATGSAVVTTGAEVVTPGAAVETNGGGVVPPDPVCVHCTF